MCPALHNVKNPIPLFLTLYFVSFMLKKIYSLQSTYKHIFFLLHNTNGIARHHYLHMVNLPRNVSSIQYLVSSKQYLVSSIQYLESSVHYPVSSIQYVDYSVQYPVSCNQHLVSSTQFKVSSILDLLSNFLFIYL